MFVVLSLIPAATAVAAPGGRPGAPALVRQCTEEALRTAVATAANGATIRFACDGTITLTPEGGGLINIATGRRLTIDGAGRSVTVDGGDRTSLFAVEGGATLSMRNLVLAHGNSQEGQVMGGGAIWNSGNLSVDRVEFVENRAFNYGGAIASLLAASKLTVTRSRFVGNVVTCPSEGNGGGAIAVFSPNETVIERSEFRGNRTVGQGAGGAVLGMAKLFSMRNRYDSAITVASSVFVGNRSEFTGVFPDLAEPPGGGAIAVYDHTLTIRQSRFADNLADDFAGGFGVGGAVLVNGLRTPDVDPSFFAHPLTIVGSVFRGNRTGYVGTAGALAIRNGPNPAAVSDSTFVDNAAAASGAILTTSPLHLDDVVIKQNWVMHDAPDGVGGITATAPTHLHDTRLLNNTPNNCGFFGAGVFIDGGGNVERPGGTCFPAVPATG